VKRVLAALVGLALVLVAARALAHKPSDSYLTLTVDGATLRGRWDVALRDLDYAIELDADGDGTITWQETEDREQEIARYVLERLRVSGCPLRFEHGLAVASHTDGAYAVVRFTATCASPPRTLDVLYTLFFDLDPQHRGVAHVEAGGTSSAHVFSASARDAKFDLGGGASRGLGVFVKEGVFHIWTGYDHVLFLLALLLPSVLRREDGEWRPVGQLRPAILDVLRVVTAFTIAHSITLSLAALGVVTLPSRLVESVIAASVLLAALNNVWPILRQDRWMAAFVLGLMHGFGFSSTLMDLGLQRSTLVVTLFGFNLGVEIGQIAIVAAFVPLAYAARRSHLYRRFGLVAGSLAIAALATVWLVERALLVKILS
jgi:hypothetical protein